MPKKDEFLEEVLSYIKFPFDRGDIKSELENHISDRMEYYTEQGYDIEKAEELTVNNMGNAKEIGIELNKQHNPLLGWIWKITNVLVTLTIVFTIFTMIPLVSSLFNVNLNTIPKSNIVYKVDVNERVKIDNRVIKFTKVIYEKNGVMNIFYEDYDTKLYWSGWSFGHIGEITDNLGTRYFTGGEYSTTWGIKSKSIRMLKNFKKEADTLIITYDNYNRSYKVEIPLPVGENNE